MYRILLISALSVLALPQSSTAQAPKQVSVVYTDGTQRTVIDWHFTYNYGASDQPFTGGPYLQLSKRTTDLLLEIDAGTEHGVGQTEERLIPASDLAAMEYAWGKGENQHTVSGIVVTLANGQELSTLPPLRVAKKLLSTKPFVFATSIWLHGTVLVDGSKAPFEVRIDDPYGTGYPQEKVALVRFRSTTKSDERLGC
jgi:hypothetical protein